MKKYIFVIALAFIVSGCGVGSTSKVHTSSTVDSDKAASSSQDHFEAFESSDAKIDRVNQNIEKVYFAFDSFALSPQMQETIKANAEIFNTQIPNASILIEGNCDEWGTDEYNQALGLKRAKAAKEALIARGVAADRISLKSYGETNPICSERTKACDAKNRRDDFKVSQ